MENKFEEILINNKNIKNISDYLTYKDIINLSQIY